MDPDKDNNKFDTQDFVDHDDADAELGDDPDLGNDGTGVDEEEDASKPPAKKAAKKAPAKKATDKDADDPDAEDDPDSEEEEEEDPDAEEEEEEEPDADAAEKSQLAKKLARAGRARERLEEQVKELRAQVEKQQADRSDASKKKLEQIKEELDGLYEKVEEARAEGKVSEAAKLQKRIDEIRDGMTRSQAAFMAAQEATQQAELRAYNTMVRELEMIDPRFDPDHDDFDQELLDNVGELVDSFEARGELLTDALRRATKMLLREDVFSKGRSLKREKPVKKTEPKKTDVERNLKAAKKQPPEMPGARKEKADAEIDMENISEKDFDALPESTLRRYLGHED